MKPIPDINEVISDFPEFAGIHPIANVFPMQQPEDFWELVENIKTTGVIHPLRREKGTNLLIDGRNRLLACSITGTLFEVDDIEPHRIYGLVTGDNFHSKKYDASQKSEIARRLKPFYAAQAKERQQEHGGTAPGRPKNTSGKNSGSDSRDAAGAAVGVNGRYVDMAEQVASASPELAEDVLQGRVKIQEAFKQVKPILDQAKAQAKAEKPAKKEKPKARIITVDGRITEIDAPAKPVFNQTNDSVSWASWTWNPVTGCNHGCKFCYAREIAHSDRMAAVYPFQFAPAYHDYRLAAPVNTRKPDSEHPPDGRVFVCSMADLFGKWVPNTWIQSVFKAAADAPEWEYLFLTKWPKRYSMLAELPRAWFGASIIKQADVERVTRDMTSFDVHDGIVRWVSLEPMLEPIKFGDMSWCDLVVIGAQTSTRQPDGFVPAFSPKFEWVADLVAQCREQGVPYYLKPNLLESPGMEMAQMEPRRK
jgi:protein gp37